MKTLVDINVVFALLVEAHVHHPAAMAWWSGRADESVGLCLPVRLGVLRLLTNPRAMNDDPVNPDTALSAWDAFARDPRTVELEIPALAHEEHFRDFVQSRQPSPNLWTDAWLGALAASLQIALTSFDAGFQAYPLDRFERLQG